MYLTFLYFIEVEQLRIEWLTNTLYLSWFSTVTESFGVPLNNKSVPSGHTSSDDLIQCVPEHTINHSLVPVTAEELIKLGYKHVLLYSLITTLDLW